MGFKKSKNFVRRFYLAIIIGSLVLASLAESQETDLMIPYLSQNNSISLLQKWIEEIRQSSNSDIEKDLKTEFANRLIFQLQLLPTEQIRGSLNKTTTLLVLNKIKSQEKLKLNQTSAHFSELLSRLIESVNSDLEKSENPISFIKDFVNQEPILNQGVGVHAKIEKQNSRDYFDGRKSIKATEIDSEMAGLSADLYVRDEQQRSEGLQILKSHSATTLDQTPNL